MDQQAACHGALAWWGPVSLSSSDFIQSTQDSNERCPWRPKTLSDQTQTAWLGKLVRLPILSLHWERQWSVPLDHPGQAVAEEVSWWGEHLSVWEIFWFGFFRWHSLGSVFNTYLHVKMSRLFLQAKGPDVGFPSGFTAWPVVATVFCTPQ